ncbi:MAG TPA: hypothetical protein VIB48_15815 [Acidimicrobiia bacterium]|jgi:hypothetical protein
MLDGMPGHLPDLDYGDRNMTSEPQPKLEKAEWTAADFDAMGWHDNAVHALAFEPALPHPGRLLVDLDYIIEWVKPAPPDSAFKFWICPATLVFDAASDLVVDADLTAQSFELSLDAITRSEPDEHGIRTWSLAGHEFTAVVRAKGYRQHLRRRPVLSARQRLTPEQRGGIAFGEQGFA